MSTECRRCVYKDIVKGCLKGCKKYSYDCFKERLLKIYDVSESTDEYLDNYGAYGDEMSPLEVSKIVEHLHRVKKNSSYIEEGI